ncbi:MAG TPA: PEGA domain-containing protein [Lacunisphaera sp.]
MKIIKVCLVLGALACGFFFTGCATVVRGSTEKIAFQSDPAGAEVKLSTGQSGVTPCELVVRRKGDVQVTIKKEGFKQVETALISGISGASMGIGTAANFLTLPIVNDIVDYKTGANYSHKPNPFVVKLIPLGAVENGLPVVPPVAPVAKTETVAEPNRGIASPAASSPPEAVSAERM